MELILAQMILELEPMVLERILERLKREDRDTYEFLRDLVEEES